MRYNAGHEQTFDSVLRRSTGKGGGHGPDAEVHGVDDGETSGNANH